ncbi:MAG: Methyltransferase type 11 [Marmoricola sp.]|nr:Methyltransferase type 11 [Marmoricola sp.]
MHESALALMRGAVEKHLSKDRHYDVLDFGSFVNSGQTATHRVLLADHDVTYTGTDIQAGDNVDVVMTEPYRIPLPTASQDVVISGQVFEHIPFPQASILEIARVLRPGGKALITVPSRGHHHSTYDCFRYYPDGMRALAAWAQLDLLEVSTDWPATGPDGQRFVYASVAEDHYWGDTLAVMSKPAWRRSVGRRITRYVVLRHANKIGDLTRVPRPKGTRLHGRRAPRPAQADPTS